MGEPDRTERSGRGGAGGCWIGSEGRTRGFAAGLPAQEESESKVECDFKVFALSNWEDGHGG